MTNCEWYPKTVSKLPLFGECKLGETRIIAQSPLTLTHSLLDDAQDDNSDQEKVYMYVVDFVHVESNCHASSIENPPSYAESMGYEFEWARRYTR